MYGKPPSSFIPVVTANLSSSLASSNVSVRRIDSPSLHQKPPNATYTPNEDVPREEPYNGAETQFAEDEKADASKDGGEGKRDKGGGDDGLWVVFTNNLGDVARKNVIERLE